MNKLTTILLGGVLLCSLLLSQKSYSQTKYPDGTIIYKDGSRQLPNGKVVYPDGSRRNNNGINRTIDGILHPNSNRTVYNNRNSNRNNGQGMSPGQAKKVYGGEAKDYAPGHNKGGGKWNNRENENYKGEHGKGKSNGRGHGRDKDE